MAATPAWGQATGPAIAELSSGDLYIEAGAEAVDEPAMRTAISTAAGFDVTLKLAVFAEGDAEPLARDIAEALGSVTVLAFTPSSFGVFTNEISQGRLDDALAAARDDLSGPDAATGARAFADALEPPEDSGGVSAAVVIAAVVGVLVVVGVGGRVWEVRTREARQERRRVRRQVELQERTVRLGGRVIEMSDAVELAEDPEVSKKYAMATGLFDEAEAAIAAAPGLHELDAVAANLDRADALLTEISNALRSSA